MDTIIEKDKSVYNDFIKEYPSYKDTAIIDELRKKDFTRLEKSKHVYLDFTGGNLYAESLVDKHHQLLKEHLFGNPHSFNPTSTFSSEKIEEARQYILQHFNATDDYYCVFTQNASGALKIVGESYPFDENGHLLLTFDNHNSVNGIRQFARKNNCNYTYIPLHTDSLRLDENVLEKSLTGHPSAKNKLFAFPAQSNVTGVRHSLGWIKRAHDCGWDVLLDAAAFVPSNKLDLKQLQPEYVSISFYKIFGYPTGLGCLLIRKDAFSKLHKPWFAGGTIKIASVLGDGFYFENGHPRFEDGTVNYLDIPALKTGLEYINNIGLDKIHTRIECLTGWVLERLQQLKHSNGRSLISIYGPKGTNDRGGTISMNFVDKDGKLYQFEKIEKEANKYNISIRTGCFCNPGVDEVSHSLSQEELTSYFKGRHDGSYCEQVEFLHKLRGAVRISLGYISNFDDVEAFVQFARQFLD